MDKWRKHSSIQSRDPDLYLKSKQKSKKPAQFVTNLSTQTGKQCLGINKTRNISLGNINVKKSAVQRLLNIFKNWKNTTL